MSLPISEKDMTFVKRMIDAKALDPFVEETMVGRTLLMFCGDGQEFDAKYQVVRNAALKCANGEKPDIAMLSLFGGVLAVPPNSPLHHIADHRPAVDFQLRMGEEIGYRRLVVKWHLICRLMQKLNIDLPVYMSLCASSKKYLKENYSYRVCLLGNVHMPGGERVTWHFRLKMWEEFCKQEGIPAYYQP